ncbi:(2Fe-2S) ferredoxin domain-containing protein [Streptomyces sp. NPDC008001]|uniref:(2Fe-2S) ferredoxin domain-containing protein n=1 Tax=Streptomyces sp. NPDC008001 TaxID=3364804 RepID=UPI0036EB5B3B
MITNQSRRRAPAVSSAPCRITVCRGCCCGDPQKVPGVDHAGQIPRLRAALGDAAQVRASECLDVCDQANVVVVQPSAAGRAAGGRPVWLGLVNDDDALADIAAWIRAGGPGLAEPPGVLDLYAFTVSRRVGKGVEE